MQTISIINPNSSTEMTAGMAKALAPLEMPDGPRFAFRTSEKGPSAVASDEDLAHAAPPVRDLIAADDASAAFIIACYGDPGIGLARQITRRPVLGIGGAAMATAMTLGERFGVISISEWSIGFHARDMAARGLSSRCAGDRPLGLGVAQASTDGAIDRICEVARQLRDEDGADVLITACAGMSGHLAAVEREVGLPVVDPLRAAAAMAIGIVRARRTAA